MKVLDASFLIDYEHGVEETKHYLLAHEDEVFVIPSPIHTEYLLGEVHSDGEPDLDQPAYELSWAEIHTVTEHTSRLAAEAAAEIGPQGPRLAAIDALVVGTARELGGTVVSSDGDLTHPETKRVVTVEEYR